MLEFFKKNKAERVIKLVYPVDGTLCPECGTHKTTKKCPHCKKSINMKKTNG